MASQQPVFQALRDHRFFKLIVGGSFTDLSKVEALCRVYAMAGADCIDVSADLAVVEAVERAYTHLPESIARPALMVSLPLDADPHFRKIDLDEPACTLCDACVPICPTEALSLNDTQLLIDQPLCYGCGRCVTACPTSALTLQPLHMEAELSSVLTYPLVSAVEIHTSHTDPYMLTTFLQQYSPWLQDKIIAVCLRPEQVAPEQWLAFLTELQHFSPLPVILQVDGAPMSGTDDPEASRPALESAVFARQYLAESQPTEGLPFITISGGINHHTADLLNDPRYGFITGTGMGTMARKAVWPWLDTDESAACQVASQIVQLFKNRKKSGIMLAGAS